MGKFLIYLGISLVVIGALLSAGHLSWLGKLPGDIAVKKENFSFYFPLTTCLVLSVILTVLLWFFRK